MRAGGDIMGWKNIDNKLHCSVSDHHGEKSYKSIVCPGHNYGAGTYSTRNRRKKGLPTFMIQRL